MSYVNISRLTNTEPFGASDPNVDPSGLGGFGYSLRFPGQYHGFEHAGWDEAIA